MSEGIDFDRGAIVRLDGAWEFRDGVLADPSEFGPPGGQTAVVPGHWRSAEGFARADAPPTGVGTMRLKVALPPGEREWAIRLPNANSAVRLYANGAAIAEIGKAGLSKESYEPWNGIAYPRFDADGELELVMQIANFSAPYIGTWDSPRLGLAETIGRKRRADLVATSLISGALLIMGLYHFGLFLLRNKDRASLLFGLICLSMSVRNLIMGERLLLELLQASSAAWEWAFRIEHLSAHLTVPLFAFFFRSLYPRQIRRGPVFAILAGGAAWALLVLAAPAMISHRFLHWYEFFLLAAGLYILAAIVVAAARREQDAGIVAAGLLVLMATAVNDVLLSTGLLSRSFYMASYGVFFYIFTQSFHLSILFSKAFKEIEALSDDLRQKNKELESLHTIDLAIASSMELDRVLSIILEEAVEHLDADAADVLLLEGDTEVLSLGARLGFRSDALLHTRLKQGQGFAGRAMESDEVIYASGLNKNAEGFSRSPAFESEGFIFYSGRRLTVKGKIVGVLELYRRSPYAPTPSWELFFKTLAGQAAIALDNSALLRGLKQANEELAEANEATIESWAEALELRDQETEGHSRRVTEATVDLAGLFGISGEELHRVRHGALLHDIGKMGIPDAILLKPGPLDADEFAVMKRHPGIARDLLSRLRFLGGSLDIPYCHHEKWDGSGYPQGLSGQSIPLSARLFAVVDVWDALRSDRPYRKSWEESRVLDHLAAAAGTHFDPDAVAAFIELRRKR